MADDDLKSLFGAAEQAEPSAEARSRALQAAMAAFAEKNAQPAQGNVVPLRPIANSNPLDGQGHSKMKKQWLMGGVASAAVVVLAVSVGVQDGRVPLAPQEKLPAPAAPQSIAPPLAQNAPAAVLADAGNSRSKADSAASNEADSKLQERAEPARQAAEQAIVKRELIAQAEQMASTRMAVAPPAPVAAAAKPVSPPPVMVGMAAPMMAAPMPSAAADALPPAGYQEVGRDRFQHADASPIKRVVDAPVSTFSADVDTASYSFVRRQLNQGVLPQKDAVRVEEMVNYFDYQYPLPDSRDTPFKASVTVSDSPWKPGNKLLHIGIRGYELPREQRPASNLVFLLDVSGSMDAPDKLPLVKQSMSLLLGQLKPTDTVSIVVYAGAAGTVLEPTPVREREKIFSALQKLSAGGSTAGGEGIKLAYQLARSSFNKDAVNRVILATDGDFNVGITSDEELKGFIERQRDAGIFLSVLGFGEGNYQDALMQQLAQNGNGVAAYIDTLGEAQKVLVDEASSSLFPIARDLKLQLEFNPQTVSEYRLLGYETRALKQEDFNNDKVDAGDIGAGHRVTALYEITPTGSSSGLIEPSRYQPAAPKADDKASEYGFLKIRYKLPGEDTSRLISTPIAIQGTEVPATLARETAFSTAVAGFAELLRGGQYTGKWGYQDAIKLASANKGEDPYGYRSELVQLIRKAEMAADMK